MNRAAFYILSWFLVMGLVPAKATACVNLDINVGTIDSAEGRLFAQIVSTFIHERTGTKSIIKFYPNAKEMHAAIGEKEVELIIVNIDQTLETAGLAVGSEPEANYLAAKKIYKEDMALVLLASFGSLDSDSAGAGSISPVLAKIVLEKFPALPRLLKKLSGKIDSETTSILLSSVKDEGKKPARVAKDFLVSKRLI